MSAAFLPTKYKYNLSNLEYSAAEFKLSYIAPTIDFSGEEYVPLKALKNSSALELRLLSILTVDNAVTCPRA